MVLLELKTEEATFLKDMVGDVHFVIDCACGGQDGKGQYSGSYYKNANETLEDSTRRYIPVRSPLQYAKHTYYMTEFLLSMELREEHSEKERKEPLIIVCKDCGREFPFTIESYWKLDTRMKKEYNKQISKPKNSKKD